MLSPAIDRLTALVGDGALIMVATRDNRNRPHVTRGWGARFDPAGGHLDLALSVSDDLKVIDDIEANHAVAVTFACPTSYEAVQLTGVVEWIGDVSREDSDRIDTSIQLVDEALASIGMPASTGTRLAGDEFVTIRVAMQHCFEQTPGSSAGNPL